MAAVPFTRYHVDNYSQYSNRLQAGQIDFCIDDQHPNATNQIFVHYRYKDSNGQIIDKNCRLNDLNLNTNSNLYSEGFNEQVAHALTQRIRAGHPTSQRHNPPPQRGTLHFDQATPMPPQTYQKSTPIPNQILWTGQGNSIRYKSFNSLNETTISFNALHLPPDTNPTTDEGRSAVSAALLDYVNQSMAKSAQPPQSRPNPPRVPSATGYPPQGGTQPHRTSKAPGNPMANAAGPGINHHSHHPNTAQIPERAQPAVTALTAIKNNLENQYNPSPDYNPLKQMVQCIKRNFHGLGESVGVAYSIDDKRAALDLAIEGLTYLNDDWRGDRAPITKGTAETAIKILTSGSLGDLCKEHKNLIEEGINGLTQAPVFKFS